MCVYVVRILHVTHIHNVHTYSIQTWYTYRLTLGCRKYTRGSYQYCARAKPKNEGVFLQPRVNLFVAMGTVVADNDN